MNDKQTTIHRIAIALSFLLFAIFATNLFYELKFYFHKYDNFHVSQILFFDFSPLVLSSLSIIFLIFFKNKKDKRVIPIIMFFYLACTYTIQNTIIGFFSTHIITISWNLILYSLLGVLSLLSALAILLKWNHKPFVIITLILLFLKNLNSFKVAFAMSLFNIRQFITDVLLILLIAYILFYTFKKSEKTSENE